MPNRHESYNEEIAKKFQSPKYAQEYLFNTFNHGECSIDEAVRTSIKAMGLKSFSDKSGLSIQAVSDFVSKRQKWSTDKLIKIIDLVFKLKVKLSFEKPESRNKN